VADLERAKDGVPELAADPELRSIPPNRIAGQSTEWRDAVSRLAAWVDAVQDDLVTGEPDAADRALAYLETDVYYFCSGYARDSLARMLAQVDLTDAQKARARRYVLACVDGRKHCKHPGLSNLAGAVANNDIRVQLRNRLYDDSWAIATRALRCLLRIRRPGYDEGDIAAARKIALHRGDWTMARRFWSQEWESDLREIASFHNLDRANAKELLRNAEWRDARRKRKGGRNP
jgi:hypothetical protein